MKYQRLPLLAYIILLPSLISLGVWQLNRAEEKRIALNQQESLQGKEALLLSGQMMDNPELFIYRDIHSTGHFENERQYLLDNQVNQSKAGFFVFTPFLLKDEKIAVLVNRGWLPLGRSRDDLPDVSVDSREMTISGRINWFPSVGLKLAGAEMPGKTWPVVIQVIDTAVISRQLGYKLLPFQVELDKNAPNGYIRDWRTVQAMPPEKHVAYAVQWFLLAITLTILFVKYGRQKNHD